MTDDNEWGNLLDSESLSRNNRTLAWTENRKAKHVERSKDPKFLEQHQKGVTKFFNSDAALIRNKKLSDAQQQKLQDPEYRKFLKQHGKKLSESEEFKQTCTIAQNNRTEEHKINQRNSLYETMNTQEWKDANKKSAQDRAPLYHTPMGIMTNWEYLEKYKKSIFNKMKSLPHLYYAVGSNPGVVKNEKVYYSPYGAFPNSKEIWELAVLNKCKFAIVNWITRDYSPYFKKMSKKYPNEYYTKVEPKREWDLEEHCF